MREGARRMLAAALQAEVAAYIDQFADQVDGDGRRLVVRNGYHAEREVLTAAGAVTVKTPRVNDKRVNAETGERQRFSSAILPAWCRRSPQVNCTPVIGVDVGQRQRYRSDRGCCGKRDWIGRERPWPTATDRSNSQVRDDIQRA